MNADRLKSTSVKERLGIPRPNARRSGDSHVKDRLGKFNSSPLKPLLSKQRQRSRSDVRNRLNSTKMGAAKYQNNQLFKRALEQTQTRGYPSRRPIRTKSNDDYEPLRVRISTGDVVTGLRSDQIILQKKKNIARSPVRRPIQSEMRRQRTEVYEPIRKRTLPSRSLSGITKHIQNDTLRSGAVRRLSRQSTISAPRSKVVRPFMSSASSSRYSVRTPKSLMMSKSWESSDEEPPSPSPPPRPSKPLKKLKINITNEHAMKRAEEPLYITDNSEDDYDSEGSLTETDLEAMKQMLLKDVRKKKAMRVQKTVSSPPVKQAPKVHAQILDNMIQKEIAVLQGKPISDNTGSGSGVKNFKMLPTISRKPLTERFRIDDSTMEVD